MSEKCGIIKRATNLKIVDLTECSHRCTEIIKEGNIPICPVCEHMQLGVNIIKDTRK